MTRMKVGPPQRTTVDFGGGANVEMGLEPNFFTVIKKMMRER